MTRLGRLQTRTVILTLALMALVILSAVIFGKTRNRGERRRVTIAQVGDFFLYAPIYVAVDNGSFAQQGLDVSIISTGGDDKTWAAVLSGDALVGVGDPTFVAISASRGVEGRIIASIVDGVPFWGIATKDEIRPAEDLEAVLRGRTVATFPSPSTAFALQTKLFTDLGLPPHIREGGFGTLIPMLQSGAADIALELEPNVSTALTQGAHIVYSMTERYGSFAITGLYTTPRALQDSAEDLAAIVCGVQSALDFIRSNPDSSLRLLHARFPELPEEIASAALGRAVGEGVIPPTVVTDSSGWVAALELRQAIGDLNSGPVSPDLLARTFTLSSLTGCQRT